VYPCVLPFTKNSFSNGETNHSKKNLFAPKDEFLEPPPSKPITASGYELHPGFIAMVRE
jgi:hypothetical protein